MMGTLPWEPQSPDSRSQGGGGGQPQADRAHLQQREVGQQAGVQLFHVVEKFNQLDVSPAQLVAHKVVLSMALQHLAEGGVSPGAQVREHRLGAAPAPPPPSPGPLRPHWAGVDPHTFCAPPTPSQGPGGFLLSPPQSSGEPGHHFLLPPGSLWPPSLLLPRGPGLSPLCTGFCCPHTLECAALSFMS